MPSKQEGMILKCAFKGTLMELSFWPLLPYQEAFIHTHWHITWGTEQHQVAPEGDAQHSQTGSLNGVVKPSPAWVSQLLDHPLILWIKAVVSTIAVFSWFLYSHRTSLVAQTVKASAYNAGDPGSIPGFGRSSGEGNGSPLQYSCLENPMDRGAWQAAVHGVAESRHD